MNKLWYKEDESGAVHVMQLDCMDEGTLCGLGCDNPTLQQTGKKVVTCAQCIFILKTLRKVKYEDDVDKK